MFWHLVKLAHGLAVVEHLIIQFELVFSDFSDFALRSADRRRAFSSHDAGQ